MMMSSLPISVPRGWRQGLSPTLKNAKSRANKALSHLTLARKKGQTWDTEGLLQEINGIAARFVSEASPSKLSPKVGEWLNFAKRPAGGAVPLISSNTTSTITVFPPKP